MASKRDDGNAGNDDALGDSEDVRSRSPLAQGSPAQPLRYGDGRFQDEPGWPEYPVYDVDVVSCALPSGAAWLFSCLLELGVSAWKPWNADTRLEWLPRGERRFRYWCAGDPWRRLAPGLVSGREFTFRSTPVPRYSHRWPEAHHACARTILIVRDPRDALYSAWRRHEAQCGLDGTAADRFVAYAEGIEHDSRRAAYWDRFHAKWLEHVADRPSLIVRFEDFKRDPVGVLASVCGFLDMPDSTASARLRHATEVSSFDNVLRIDTGMVSRNVFNWAMNRAGLVDEHLTAYDESMTKVFAGADVATWQRFGYER